MPQNSARCELATKFPIALKVMCSHSALSVLSPRISLAIEFRKNSIPETLVHSRISQSPSLSCTKKKLLCSFLVSFSTKEEADVRFLHIRHYYWSKSLFRMIFLLPICSLLFLQGGEAFNRSKVRSLIIYISKIPPDRDLTLPLFGRKTERTAFSRPNDSLHSNDQSVCQ